MAQLLALCLSEFFLLFTFSAHAGAADDSLFRGQSLSGGQTMVSGGGKVELGFFAPGNSSKYYIGIWYKVSKQPVVWVANREKPVASASSSELTLAEDGNLVLRLKVSKNQIWSSNSSSSLASNSTVAVLLDDGNLVLKDNVTSDTLWQSFDHPTNAWLPGAKLGYNKLTGQDWFLTSWRNPEDPSPGMFTMEFDPNGSDQFYLVRDRRHRYATSGLWTGDTFAGIPEIKSNHFFDISHVYNANVNEFSFRVRDRAATHYIMLDFTGELRRQRWDNDDKVMLQFFSLPRDPCDVDGRCGPFGSCNNFTSAPCQCLQGFNPRSSNEWALGDHTGGCVRRTALRCGERDRFLELPNTQPPANPVRMSTIGGREECRTACLRNCSCIAYAYHSECSIWQGDLLNLKSLGSSNGAESGAIYVRVDASELAVNDHKNRKKTATIFVGAVSGVAAIAVVVLLLASRYCKGATVGGSAITPKADVYSFGLMLHEIVSGRRNRETREECNRLYFPLWAAIKLQEGDTLCLLDPRLKGKVDEEELSRVCRIACWCIQDLECSRPSMGEVVQQLEGVLDVSIPPIPALLKKLVDDESAANNYYTTTT
uniref:Uncharacterized protein n=1 Tax=Musa acuminata subsp. malaccensis TaxID=214687 RepID=A0A804HUJ5_MUSAM